MTPDRPDQGQTDPSSSQDEGFIGSQGSNSDTGGTDFAARGQGATDDDSISGDSSSDA